LLASTCCRRSSIWRAEAALLIPLVVTGPGMSWSGEGTRTQEGKEQWSGHRGPTMEKIYKVL